MQKSKNRQELFDNTINHFNSENRGIEFGTGYIYRTSDGRGCAIGREISDKLAKELDNCSNGDGVAIHNDNQFNKLPIRLKRMGQDFLYGLQLLHDNDINWDSNGLSDIGMKRAKKIAEKYKLYTSSFEEPF